MLRLCSVGCFFAVVSCAVGQTGKAPTAREVIAEIIAHTGVKPPPGTVDTIKAGDPDTPVTGIATSFAATLDVLQRAAASGKNLVVSHEPTFYNHQDQITGLENDPVYQAKRKFIADHKMVVWRFHDTWHMRDPDGILVGMTHALGWERYRTENDPHVFTLPPTTLADLASQLRDRLKIKVMRVVGDPQLKITTVGLLPGASGRAKQIAMLERPEVQALVAGEASEWETVEYTRDAVTAGKRKALILLGHVPSEEAGMDECARWLRTFLHGIPVEFLPASEPFWTPR